VSTLNRTIQGGVGSEIQQGVFETNGEQGGGGSGLGAVAARSYQLQPVAVAPELAPMKGCMTRFSYQSLFRATNNFDKRLGSGSFSSVFQGVLTSGTRVAVKRLAIDPNLGPA